MKLIIAGSRTNCPDPGFIEHMRIYNGIRVSEVVSGTAKGADRAGENWATLYNKSVKRFPANWDKFGKAAGHIRNSEMAKYGDALLLIWDGESRGSKNMKDTMLKLNKPVYEVILKSHNIILEDEEL